MEKNYIIKNEFDGDIKPNHNIEGGQFHLDFAYSTDAKEVDSGIRETIKGVKLSIMAMGIALYRIDLGGLFIDLGFRKFGEYIDKLAEDTGMARTSLYNWEYIGEAYIKHRTELDNVGFNDDDGPTKLPYLMRALENHPKREVFKNIKNMSKREFEEWSREIIGKKEKKYKTIKIKGKQVFVGNTPIISFADGISPKERNYYEGVLLEAAMAVKQNEVVGIFRFYDDSEKKRFEKFYQRELKAIRAKN